MRSALKFFRHVTMWNVLPGKIDFVGLVLLLPIVLMGSLHGEEPLTTAQIEFFEGKIRPLLTEHCLDCHNSQDTAEGGLALDHRSAMRKGGQSGTPFDFKTPQRSLLLKVLRHEIPELEMPDGSDRLKGEEIQAFERWIQMGAPDPRVDLPVQSVAGSGSWESVLEERKKWWSFQPVRSPAVPDVVHPKWSQHPVDRFVFAELTKNQLEPSAEADRDVLIRRLSFVLRGLPPSPDEIDAFVKDKSPAAYENLVDRYLDSPQYGEHWARHWMDLVRYAETHGSEGDPAVPFAWKYRDYLIRAFNADLPYDQFVKEQIAGDILPEPRINAELKLNESAIGPAHLRMCFHGFAPTDALDEKVRFTDDQINVVSKTFLGLTLSCARCHNHKFDAISQADYYATFGILGSTRPGMHDINLPQQQQAFQDDLNQIKTEVRQILSKEWTNAKPLLKERIEQAWKSISFKDAAQADHLFYPLFCAKEKPEELQRLSEKFQQPENRQLPEGAFEWDFSSEKDFAEWFAYGNGSATRRAVAGEFVISENLTEVGELIPDGVYSHLISTKHRNVLASPKFQLDGDYEIWVHVSGDSQAMLRYVVQNYPRSGTVYPVTKLNSGKWKWQKYDMTYWNGEEVHIELSTAADTALLVTPVDRSWFGVRRVVVAPKGAFRPPADLPEYIQLFIDEQDQSQLTLDEMLTRYVQRLSEATNAWTQGRASDLQIALINSARKLGLLQISPDSLKQIRTLINTYQQIEAKVPLPNRVPGVLEADSADQALFIRGNHRQPAAEIPRRFLEAIDSSPYATPQSGRLQFAEDLVHAENPFTSRVIVNRIWHYLFGAGLVRTVDNFGQLGEPPSHPELLDYLATEMKQNHWSIKQMVRSLLMTQTWKQSSLASDRAVATDPENRLLSHANVRRLEAEVLRDSLLLLSGRLDQTMFGPPSGNATSIPRRSLYLSLQRNSLNPFLATFDAPVPFATQGRRDVTNVPAQSLTLLNDPFVKLSAKQFANRFTNVEQPNERVQSLYKAALGRKATAEEVALSIEYVTGLQVSYRKDLESRQEIESTIRMIEQELEEIRIPIRAKILEKRGLDGDTSVAVLESLVEWDFTKVTDLSPDLKSQLKGTARVENGALVLDGRGYLASPPLAVSLNEKSLEVVVELDNLDQRGGGAISVQDLRGNVFDAVVFAEKDPRQWLAGSDHFHRTQSFQGTTEEAAHASPVHIVITYSSDGTIRGYRNGVPYGKAYKSSGPVNFKANDSQVLLGLRHGSPAGNRLLTGKILQARVYDRSLSPEEVEALSSGNNNYVSNRQIEAAMSQAEKSLTNQNTQQIAHLHNQIKQLGEAPLRDQEWAELAQAIMNFKEFLYIR